MSADNDLIWSDDFTRVIKYQSRQFTLGDLSLAAIGGIQWDAVPPAVLTALACAALPAFTALLCGGGLIWSVVGVPLLVMPIPLIVTYVRFAKDRKGGLGETEKRALKRLGRRAPTCFLGLDADTEPDAFDWTAIFWVPAPSTASMMRKTRSC